MCLNSNKENGFMLKETVFFSGYKFAAMQIKIGLVNYLRNYKYSLNHKTPENLTFDHATMILCPVEEIILDVKAIK